MVRRALPVTALLAALAAGCDDGMTAEEEDRVPQARRVLVRASLDLRGVRPSDEEIAAVEADPDALGGLLDEFVADERFPERLVELYNELYLTRSEGLAINTAAIGVRDKWTFFQLVGQEPLRLLAEIAALDLPYTEIVEADWTMANEGLAEQFPVDYPEGETGWKRVSYTDGRPAAGVLATNGLWWRYTTTPSNANRGRAAAMARLLLCQDYLDRDVEIDPTVFLQSEAAVAAAISSNESCANCHVSLDPLGSNFFGFYLSNYTSSQEALVYHESREPTWSELTGVEPGYFGVPTTGLDELGGHIAADPRLVSCAVEQAWTLMLRREPRLGDQERMNAVRESFLSGGLRLRALYRAIVDEADYQGLDPEASGVVGAKVATVELLAAEVEDLTGYAWTQDGTDMLHADQYGYHLVAGGVDGLTQTAAPSDPAVGLVLVQEKLAELAAAYAVSIEPGQAAADRRLFTEIDFTETADAAPHTIRAQLVLLHLRLYGARVEQDSEAVNAGLELWEALYASEGDVSEAWRGVLQAMLRDPDMIIY